MRNLTKILCFLLCWMSLTGTQSLLAQSTYRSAKPAAAEKVESIAEDLPCGGSTLFSEDFEAGIPSTWIVIDGDGLTPKPQIQLAPGWQSRADYRDSANNKVVASASWYTTLGASNDWLISPAITVGTNSCLSWKGYSQDQYFKETYEVRIATQPDTASFLANAALKTVTDESATPHFSTASLLPYAGQTIYVAFRQTSNDKFVLCLDDVKVSNVNTKDIGVLDLTYNAAEPGDSVIIRFKVANYGSDTITSFQAIYRVDGGPAEFMNVSAVSLPPNSTVSFNHDSLFYSDTLDAFHDLCAWTNLPNTVLDQDQTNDSLCVVLPIGHPVAVTPSHLLEQQLLVYPNPFSETVRLELQGLAKPRFATLQIFDLQGKLMETQAATLSNGSPITLALSTWPAGMYFLKVDLGQGQTLQRKLIKH